MNYQEEIENLLPKLPHRLQVSFALYCAQDVYHLVRDKNKEMIKKTLDIAEAWLRGEASAEECRAAANAIYATAINTVYATAVYAAYAAANAAANAATANAIYAAAANAAYAATANANTANAAYKKYYEVLIDMVKSLSRVEKAIWRLE